MSEASAAQAPKVPFSTNAASFISILLYLVSGLSAVIAGALFFSGDQQNPLFYMTLSSLPMTFVTAVVLGILADISNALHK